MYSPFNEYLFLEEVHQRKAELNRPSIPKRPVRHWWQRARHDGVATSAR